MSTISGKVISYVAAAAAVLSVALLAGCGGGGGGGSEKIAINGRATTSRAKSAVVITTNATGGTVTTLTVDGVATSVVIPSTGAAGSLPAGTLFAIIKAGSQFVAGTYSVGSVSVNGLDASGVSLDADGKLLQTVALPVIDRVRGNKYTLTARTVLVRSRSLNIQIVEIGVLAYAGVLLGETVAYSTAPVNVVGLIPSNGAADAGGVGNYIQLTFNGPNTGKVASGAVYYSSAAGGFTLSQTRTIDSNNVARFDNLVADGVPVPSGGVYKISLQIPAP